DGAVATQVWLLAEPAQGAADVAVGDEAAAGEVVVRAVVLEHDAAVDVDPADGRGLPRRPELGCVVAPGAEGVDGRGGVGGGGGREGDVQVQGGQRPPEVVVGVAVLGARGAQVVEHVDGTVDHG